MPTTAAVDTPEPTASPLPTAEPTAEPTIAVDTPEPTATTSPLPSIPFVWINEIFSAPDAEVPTAEEWIELYNPGPDPADLNGWVLQTDVEGAPAYQIPAGTILQPGAFGLFFGQQTGLILDDNDGQIHLLRPDGAVADSVRFTAVSPPYSYSRDEFGGWRTDWPASPGAPNLPLDVLVVPEQITPGAAMALSASPASLEKQTSADHKLRSSKKSIQ
jgi:hypothetical protein